MRSLRLRELQNIECMTAVRAGLGSIIPLQLLTMLSPLEMELRTCGLPYINLEFLKVKLTFVSNLFILHYNPLCVMLSIRPIFFFLFNCSAFIKSNPSKPYSCPL